MRIAKVMKCWLLVIPGCLLLSAGAWGQSWGPRASVQVEFGAPVRFVEVDRRWDNRRWDRDENGASASGGKENAAKNGAAATAAKSDTKSGGNTTGATSYLERAARHSSHGQCSRKNGHE